MGIWGEQEIGEGKLVVSPGMCTSWAQAPPRSEAQGSAQRSKMRSLA